MGNLRFTDIQEMLRFTTPTGLKPPQTCVWPTTAKPRHPGANAGAASNLDGLSLSRELSCSPATYLPIAPLPGHRRKAFLPETASAGLQPGYRAVKMPTSSDQCRMT